MTVVVLGAGPMGLGVAAHLRAAGVPTTIFGRTLGFWREHMPHDMLLRSRARASSIAEPSRGLRIEDWAAASGRPLSLPVTIGEFLAYGDWFQARAVPDLDGRFVETRRLSSVKSAGWKTLLPSPAMPMPTMIIG